MINYINYDKAMGSIENTKLIVFDKGGTLSKPVKGGPEHGIPNYKKIMKILGVEGDPAAFGKIIAARDKNYKSWALESNIELSEEMRCTSFLFPEYPQDLVEANAEELTLLFSHSKGVRELREEAVPVIQRLHSLGYKIGVISNTVSRVLVPGELEEAGLDKYVDVLVMSSITNIRKPAPLMFTQAAKKVDVAPNRCIYVGDQPNRDVEGPRRAGYGFNIILKTSNYPKDPLPEIQQPDITIDSLNELTELFGKCNL